MILSYLWKGMRSMFDTVKLDWTAIKCYHKRLLILPLSLFVIGWFSPIWLVPLGTFLLFSFSINVFAVEEKGDLNRLYLTLPVKRSKVVRGRYVQSFLLFAGGVMLGLALMPLANLISSSKWYPDYQWVLAVVSFSFLFYGLMILFMYPLLFRMGYQKGKLWGYYLPAGCFCLIYIAIMQYDMIACGGMLVYHMLVFASEHMLLVSGGMFALGALMLAISYWLSVRIYERREF